MGKDAVNGSHNSADQQTPDGTGGSSFVDRLRSAIVERVLPNDQVVIAVSGGRDSVALLHGWLAADPVRSRCTVAHVDHRLRPGSAEDAQFVESLCGRLSVPFECHVADPTKRQGRSPEEWARETRYDFFARVADQVRAKRNVPVVDEKSDHEDQGKYGSRPAKVVVAVAHTVEDQVETVLLAILRGTGLHGLVGMPVERELAPGVWLIRPLLAAGLSHGDAELYLDTLSETFRDDPTNADPAWTRNRIRNRLLPLLREEFNERVDAAFLRLADHSAQVARWLDREADYLLETAVVVEDDRRMVLKLHTMRSVDGFARSNALRRAWLRLDWPRQRMGQREWNRVAEMIALGTPSAIDLPDGVRATLQSGHIIFVRELRELPKSC